MANKKVFIKTYGCQMNVYDSARMADVLAPLGFTRCETPENADLVILNTCHIREKASEKVYSELGRLGQIKDRKHRAGEPMLVAVAGCVAQAEGEEILRRSRVVDMVFGPQTYHRLPEMLARAGADAMEGGKIVETDFPVEEKFDGLPEESAPQGAAAFLTIQEGCDKFCTFCVVPYTRGAEFSRPVDDVFGEARRLVASGAVEITLLGQNVNAYHGQDGHGKTTGLGRLIRLLAETEGLERLRYTTSHPRDVDDELIAAHRDVEGLMPYLHLPVQSGSDRILAAMNRGHGADDYRRIIDRLRAVRPDIALSSDFIVGFPGETDEDFLETMRLVRETGFAQAYSFKYSARPGTPGADMKNQVADGVKAGRLAELQAELSLQQNRFNAGFMGRTVPVLLDRPGRADLQLAGRSPYMQAVHVTMPDRAAYESCYGRIVPVEITGVLANSMTGTVNPGETAREPGRRYA